MEISGLLEDAELIRGTTEEPLLPLRTRAGKEAYNSMIRHISTNVSLLQKKAAFIHALRTHADPSITEDIQILAQLEPLLEISTQPQQIKKDDATGSTESTETVKSTESAETVKSTESAESAAQGQLFFTSESFRFLNSIPWVIRILTFFKIYIAPISALFIPLVMIIMPYFMLQYIFHVPVSWEQYQVIMKRLILGISPNEPWTLKHIVQAIWTVGSIGQSMFQPFFSAYHTYKLDRVYTEKGIAYQRYITTAQSILKKAKACGIRDAFIPAMSDDVYVASASLSNQPKLLSYYTHIMGAFEVYWAISQNPQWNPVHWHKGNGLYIRHYADLCIDPSKAVYSNVSLKDHSLLSGPNRGGKSSNLRGILQAVILGQVFGMSPVKSIAYQPYDWIYTRLKTKDSPGKQSLFEKEVYAVSRIQRLATQTKNKHGLVLIDELFHSTNPPDAEISARIFLTQFWKSTYVNSIISTHVFSLVKEAPSHIHRLCCNAEESISGQIIYSYRLTPGVCTLSSVKEVLREAKLLPR